MADFPQQYIPYKLIAEHDTMFIQWLFAGEKKFTEPFFSDTITMLLHSSVYEASARTRLQDLPAVAGSINSIPPAAFIFHVSRCGSTLLSQLLSLADENIVLSEVPLLDDILRLPLNKSFPQRNEATDIYYKAAMRLYGQKRTPFHKTVFVKTDSWHLLFYDQLRRLYPDVPFIILYRQPAEVVHSQSRQRGMHSVPGTIEPELFGFTEADITFDLDQYMSRVLDKYHTAILRAAENDPLCFLFNYNQGMMPILKSLMTLCCLSFPAAFMRKAEDRCKFHSKSPSILFEEKNSGKSIPSYLQSCITSYHEMEQKRRDHVSCF